MIVLVAELLWTTLWPLFAIFGVLCALFTALLLATHAITAWDLRGVLRREARKTLVDEIEEYLSGR